MKSYNSKYPVTLRRAAEQFTWLWALTSKQQLMSKYNNHSKPARSVNEIMQQSFASLHIS